MGRKKEKTEQIPLDTLSRLLKYSRGNLTWLYHNHNEFAGMSIQSFYSIMRKDPGTESNVSRFVKLDLRLAQSGLYDNIPEILKVDRPIAS